MVERNKAEEIIDDSQLGEEVFELEFDDDDVEYYIVDEDDNEIGVCVKENGQLVEYLYEEEPESAPKATDYVKKQVSETADSLKNMKEELYKSKDDAQAVAKELKDAKDEIENLLGDVKDSLKIFPSKKKK